MDMRLLILQYTLLHLIGSVIVFVLAGALLVEVNLTLVFESTVEAVVMSPS
jgi:hypothetical protein